MTVINIELNELNFDYVKRYVDSGELPGFAKLLGELVLRETTAEGAYSHLEPWIQWPTVYTGLTYAEHKVFRLGDSVEHSHHQIFELVEKDTGQPVVAVSPMNAVNRVSDKSVFIPDPWTNTDVTAPPSCRNLFGIVKRLVNENTHGLALRPSDIVMLPICMLPNLRFATVTPIVKMILKAATKKWARPLVLDLILASVFISQTKKKSPRYASLFLNAGAHIQHHYLFSSAQYTGESKNPAWFVDDSDDPVLEVYKVYDNIVQKLFAEFPEATIFISTGLSQRPNLKTVHYYRPKNHKGLVGAIVKSNPVVSVDERMSRDFLVTCPDEQAGREVAAELEGVQLSNGESLLRVDLRGASIFCQVAYHGPPDDRLQVKLSEGSIFFAEYFSHVTIENGIHQTEGYILRSDRRSGMTAVSSIPLQEVFSELREACVSTST